MDNKTLANRFRSFSQLIGNTPMVQITYRHHDEGGNAKVRNIYAKCEYYNYTGSIKDRMGLYMIREAYHNGSLKPDMRIIEVSSGNGGISLVSLGRALGHKITVYMPRSVSEERKKIIKCFGAELVETDSFTEAFRIAEEVAKEPDVFYPKQFENAHNVLAHQETTGCEIALQLLKAGLRPTAFTAGVGTGGTVVGVGKTLKTMIGDVNVHPLEPMESPILTTGNPDKHKHRIQGLSDEIIPAIISRGEKEGIIKRPDDVVQVSDGDAILAAQQLSSKLGLGVGISSGANLLGAIQLRQKYGPDSVIATVFADCNKKYLSTALMEEIPPKEGYISPKIELLDVTTMQRAY